MSEIKTKGDPIIDYFDTNPTYGQLQNSQEKVFSTMAHIEIQMYLSDKIYNSLQPWSWYLWLRNFMPAQNIKSRGLTNWANNRIRASFGCDDCSATSKFDQQ